MHNKQRIVVDSNLDRASALKQNPDLLCPEDIIKCQEIIKVTYFSFDGKIHQGQVIIHRELSEDIRKIFQVILEQKFLITSVIPVADPCFHWDDELSMQADNTSGFNYRTIACTNRLSNHADGRAIDINPFRNPYIRKDLPHLKHGGYNVKVPGTIIKGDKIVSTFEEMGWIWGGNWEDDRKDYQHFEKPTK